MLYAFFVFSRVDRAVPEEGSPVALPVAVDPVARVVEPLKGIVREIVDDASAVRDVAAAEPAAPDHGAFVQARVQVAVAKEELRKNKRRLNNTNF
jgi:hypothetical protein